MRTIQTRGDQLNALTWHKCSPSVKLLLYALNDHGGIRQDCFPSLQVLADNTGLSRRSVYRILGRLESQGYIRVDRRKRKNGSNTSNRYLINYEKLLEVSNERRCRRPISTPVDRDTRSLPRDTVSPLLNHPPKPPTEEKKPSRQIEPVSRPVELAGWSDSITTAKALAAIKVRDPWLSKLAAIPDITPQAVREEYRDAVATSSVRNPSIVVVHRLCARFAIPTPKRMSQSVSADVASAVAQIEALRRKAATVQIDHSAPRRGLR